MRTTCCLEGGTGKWSREDREDSLLCCREATDPACACMHPGLEGGGDLPLARCDISWVTGRSGAQAHVKSMKYIPASPWRWCWRWWLWGLEEQRTGFTTPAGSAVPAGRQRDIRAFGVPPLLPYHSTASSRAEGKQEHVGNKHPWPWKLH